MRPSTQLTSAVFQLTPTRTRCELIIISNDKKEKIASGLINPFLTHLKIAQEEIAKGGYSILLEPESSGNATWFTKATMERFVRFVSTPEILERVYTVETEILQIEEAISIHSHHDIGHNSDGVVNLHNKPVINYAGDKSMSSADEKAIIVYTPGAPLLEANGSYQHEDSSKLQLLKVLENRKAVLQKEQGMAFARAVAAGFDMDDMVSLITFAECFGAQRLKDACSRFLDLCKRKHETGQWLDIQPSEALSAQSHFSMVNASGIVLSDTLLKHDDSNPAVASQRNGKLDPPNEAGEDQASTGLQERYQTHFPQLMYPPWSVSAFPGGQQVFQSYPMQGIPYYQPYASNHFFEPNPQHMEHYPSNFSPYTGLNGQPHDAGDGEKTRENSRTHVMASDTQIPQSNTPQFKVRGSKKQQSSTVVIRNINYISSKRKSSESETDPDSHSDPDGEMEYYDDVTSSAVHQNQRSSRGGSRKSTEKLTLNNDDLSFSRKDTGDGDWQAFQECLLRSDANSNDEKNEIFAREKDVKVKRKSNSANDDSLTLVTRKLGEIRDGRMTDINLHSEKSSLRPPGSGDEVLASRNGNELTERNHQIDFQFSEANGRKLPYGTDNEDFLIGSQNLDTFRNSSDPRDMNGFNGAAIEKDKDYSNGVSDESLFIPFRSMSLGHVEETDRTDVDVYSEIPFKNQKLEKEKRGKKMNYEPNDLSWMPERCIDQRSMEYNLAMDYEMQVCAKGSKDKLENDVNDVGALKKSQKDRKSKINSVPSVKNIGGPIRKSKALKMSTHEDARVRAERIRSYKADMQRMKKEKEEAEMKRLESLKLERQKRIAARASSDSVKPSSLTSQVKQMPAKLSPAANRISKFSDSEPGSSSPLQRSKIRASLGYNESNKALKTSKLSDGGHMAGNRLARSASSLSDAKRDNDGVTPDVKTSISRLKRLSEPKTVATKARSAEAAIRRKLSDGSDKSKVSAAIINLDRSKAETLPELKIRTSKSHVNTGDCALIVKDVQNGDEMGSHNKNTQLNASNCTLSPNADGNRIVEKTVVVLENENPSFPTTCPSRGKSVVHNQHQVKTVRFQQDTVGIAILATPENPNQDSEVQISPSEEPFRHYSDHGKAPFTSSGMLSKAEEDSIKEFSSRVKEAPKDHIKATAEKAFVKEPSKGLRRLLKFGKKNHASSAGDQSADSDFGSGEAVGRHLDARKMVSTSEVHTLRRLISEDEASTAAVNPPKKSSRHFSLLSPFRAKATEKKQAMRTT